MTTIKTPGRYDLPAEVYHADPAPKPSLSSTVARTLLARSPWHAWAASPRLNPHHESEIKDSYEIGRATHTALLSKGTAIHVMSVDSYRTKDARAERDEARESGLTVLLPQQAAEVEAMAESARFQLSRHGVGDVFDRGEPEVAFFAEMDGVWVRCMTDCLDEDAGVIYDYKTTAASAEPGAFQRTVCNYGYDVQAAHYLAVVQAVTGRPWRFRFIVQEKSAPYALSVVELSEAFLATAAEKADRARELWRRCREQFGDKPWPGYPSQVVQIDEPGWHEAKWLGQQEAEADLHTATGMDAIDLALKWQAPTT